MFSLVLCFTPIFSAVPADAGILHRAAANDVDGDVFLAKITPILSESRSMRVFAFSPACQKCHNANLTLNDFASLPPGNPLNAETQIFLKKILAQRSSFLFGIRKAMPFFADYGIIIDGAASRSLFLISSYGNMGRLVTLEPIPARVSIVNIDPIISVLKMRVLSLLGREGSGQ